MPLLRFAQSLIFVALMVSLTAAFAARAEDGIRAGSFIITPSVTVAGAYDSNVFRLDTPRTDTLRVVLSPELKAASDWGRHAVKLEMGADAGVFTHSGDDNFVDARLRLAGQIDVTRRFRLNLASGVRRAHDPRGSDDVPAGIAEPVRFLAFDVDLGAEVEFGNLLLAPFASWRQFDFRDVDLVGGGTANQDDRDRRELEAGLELAFAPGRAWAFLIRASVFDIDYRQATSTAGPARDAFGYAALTGIRLDFTRLLQGRITGGILHQNYDDAGLSDVTTLTIDTGLDWRPTRRLTFQIGANRRIAETAVANAAGRISTTASLATRYELLRTLYIGASARFAHDDFQGIARSDNGFSIGLDADWSPMRGVAIRPDYAFTRRQSDQVGEDYAAHVLTLSVTYTFGAQQ